MKKSKILKTTAFITACIALICTVLSAYALALCLVCGVYENGDRALTARVTDNILRPIPTIICSSVLDGDTEHIKDVLSEAGVSAVITAPDGTVSIIGEDFSASPNYPLTFKCGPLYDFPYRAGNFIASYIDIDGKPKPITSETIVEFSDSGDAYEAVTGIPETSLPTAEYGKDGADAPIGVVLRDGKRVPVAYRELSQLDYTPRSIYVVSDERSTEDFDGNFAPEADGKVYTVSIDITDELEGDSRQYRELSLLTFVAANKYNFIWMTLLFLAVSIALLIFLASASGHTKNGIRPSIIERIPFDLYLIVCAILYILPMELGLLYGILDLKYASLAYTLAALLGLYYSALTVSVIMSIALRIKLREIFTYTLCVMAGRSLLKAGKLILRCMGYIIRNIGAMWTSVALSCALTLWALILTVSAHAYSSGTAAVLYLLGIAVFPPLFIYVGYQLNKIKQGSELIARGRVDHKIKTHCMTPNLMAQAEAVNGIGDGLSAALEERIKSERLKTELITNVSHDLKTPLTSIVNYTNLLSNEHFSEHPDSNRMGEYINILCRQSERLRKLTEDLVEASKASTGNIECRPERLDIVELISQSIGEFADRFAAAGLTPVEQHPSEPVFILADGRHLWRILDNLFTNVCKYALAGTRVYTDLKTADGNVILEIKNISAAQLCISGDELTERFVRGDSSRHTEGSGLGLSIARSLAELQSGRLEICIDGDAFKARLIFKRIM